MRPATTPREIRIETERLLLRPVARSRPRRDRRRHQRLRRVADARPRPLSLSPRRRRKLPRSPRRDGAGKNIALAIADDERAWSAASASPGIEERARVRLLAGETGHWGKGYATEAGRAFLAFLFGELGLDIVRSGVFVDNPASLRVQEKLGFERIGTRMIRCLARGTDIEHIDTILTRERHQALADRG